VTKDFAGVALPLAVANFVAALPYAVVTGARVAVIGVMTTARPGTSVDPVMFGLVSNGLGVLAGLVLLISLAYVLSGTSQFALRVARGERPEFGTVFSGGRFFAPMLGATFLTGLAVGVGSMFCLVPGLLISGCLASYSSYIVDKGMGPVAALSASWQATAPYRVNALIYAILAMLAGIAGSLACCVGALLVSTPMIIISHAYIYMKLNGEQPRLAA